MVSAIRMIQSKSGEKQHLGNQKKPQDAAQDQDILHKRTQI